jgi:hypothetical protein
MNGRCESRGTVDEVSRLQPEDVLISRTRNPKLYTKVSMVIYAYMKPSRPLRVRAWKELTWLGFRRLVDLLVCSGLVPLTPDQAASRKREYLEAVCLNKLPTNRILLCTLSPLNSVRVWRTRLDNEINAVYGCLLYVCAGNGWFEAARQRDLRPCNT